MAIVRASADRIDFCGYSRKITRTGEEIKKLSLCPISEQRYQSADRGFLLKSVARDTVVRPLHIF
jgi:hypothetical protein